MFECDMESTEKIEMVLRNEKNIARNKNMHG